jgi:hypothetical protein
LAIDAVARSSPIKEIKYGAVYKISVEAVKDGDVYVSPIRIGGQLLHAVLDTGAAYTWFVAEHFECVGRASSKALAAGHCHFQSRCKPTSSFSVMEQQGFKTRYADREFVEGQIVREDMRL